MEELEKKIEEASKKYALRDGYHDEIYKDEEAFVAGAKSEEAKAFHTQGMYTPAEVREITLKFWFWWYNQASGTNTYQAFDEWFKIKVMSKETEDKIEKAARQHWADAFDPESGREGSSESSFAEGALSPEAKEHWQEGMYTEEDMRNSFIAGRSFQRAEQYEDLTGEDHTVPDFKEWFEQNKKKL